MRWERYATSCGTYRDFRRTSAVTEVTTTGNYKGPADFGTKVHKKIADAINDKKNPNFQAEKSMIKSVLEGDRSEIGTMH